MAALIKYVCEVDHDPRSRSEYLPQITIHDGDWAFCRSGGDEGHVWHEVAPPRPIDQVRLTLHGRSLSPAGVTEAEPASRESPRGRR
jgi:hypothetical protein